MCGIAGFWGDAALARDAEPRLAGMTASLAHRGPDGQSHWLGPNVGLGHTRLAIIDIAGGAQPMWSSNGEYVTVFNGEIYNYDELKRRLEQRGYVFRTRSDTEVIWAAVDAWGIDDGLLSLRGMFAFALYRLKERRLLLARDRVGIKPLYWAGMPAGIVFGSEPKALLASGFVRQRINLVGIHDYLAVGYATPPATCWADIHVLEPGSWLEIDRRGERHGRYWNWSPRPNFEGDIEAASDRVHSVLVDSLKSHLVSDVPIGTFLSGGLDSSLITALLSECNPERTSTFSVGFGDTAFDETQYARQVAKRFDTDHHELQIRNGEGDPDLFCKIVEQYDEPFGDSSCIPSYLICQEMRKRRKVVLAGDGGDEVLGGYTRYARAQWIATLARLNGVLPLFRPIAQLSEKSFGRYGQQAAKAWRFAQMPAVERMCALQTFFTEEERDAMYQPEIRQITAACGPTSERLRKFVPSESNDSLEQLISTEMGLRLHSDYLRKLDVASSAHGLEVRVPFLDSRMLDLGAELPSRFKITARGTTKILSRQLADRYLPSGFSGRAKRGFSIPLDRWAGPRMNEFFQDLLLGPDLRVSRLIHPEVIHGIWNGFHNPASSHGISRYQRYQRFFMIVSLELWLRRWSPSLN
jgi:asparagine synthase (glutamine-hydrolysing)